MRLLCAILVLGLLSGCGGGGSSNGGGNSTGGGGNNTPPPIPSITGNWQLTATSTVVPGSTVLAGSLSNAGGTVSGVMHVAGSDCYDFVTDIPVTGTIDNTGAVTITSAAVSSQVITGTLKASTDGNSFTGTYKITGGCGNGDAGNVSGTKIPSITGNWSGSVTSDFGGSASTVNASISQGAADSHGFFSLAGTVTFPNGQCFTSGNITNSLMAGSVLVTDFVTNNGTVEVTGTLNDLSTAKSMAVSYTVSGGTCAGDAGKGTLTRP